MDPKLYIDLEVVAALVLMSIDDWSTLDPHLRALFDQAYCSIPDPLDDLQYELWEKHGKPYFKVIA